MRAPPSRWGPDRSRRCRTPIRRIGEADLESAPGQARHCRRWDGFNLHAGVRIDAGDDLGRERLARYGSRPPLSLERLRRLPGGRVAYRLKYVSRGRGKHRVMSGLEFMARLAAIIAPPRYPLLRFAGVLAPRSAWRKDIVPRPRDRRPLCNDPPRDAAGTIKPRAQPKMTDASLHPPERSREAARHASPADGAALMQLAPDMPEVVARTGEVIALAPNVLSVRHWDRLLGGALYAATPRVDWARLLRRSLDVDALQCPTCKSRLRVLAILSEREPGATYPRAPRSAARRPATRPSS